MIRKNYASLGGWTEEEYMHYWDGERRAEAAIKAGNFCVLISKGLEAAEKELPIKRNETFLTKIKKFLWH